MSITDDHELAVTREKLRQLEERVAEIKLRPGGESYARELTVRSFMSMINQLREEIARYTAGVGARSAK
jgi:hypothetical protein